MRDFLQVELFSPRFQHWSDDSSGVGEVWEHMKPGVLPDDAPKSVFGYLIFAYYLIIITILWRSYHNFHFTDEKKLNDLTEVRQVIKAKTWSRAQVF